METVLIEWGNLLIRWVHVVAGMAWIGTSFYFMHIDAALKPAEGIAAGKGGEVWEVHGGGFYRVRKYLVAPPELPQHLIWHKWASYSTWLSGVALLAWIYYLSADLYLVDPTKAPLSLPMAIAIGVGGLVAGWVVYDLLCRSPLGRNDWALFAVLFVYVVAVAWAFQQVFSGRGALIHTGGVLATIMSANVAMLIIPNQKKVVKALLAGAEPDPALGKASKQRSTHNNYLTLPVIFVMISNHYPLAYATRWSWVILALVIIMGAVIRHFYNTRHRGLPSPWWTWGVSVACALAIVWLSTLGPAQGKRADVPSPRTTVAMAEVEEIITGRCAMCHAAEPVWDGIRVAPKGVMLDTPERIAAHRREIAANSVWSSAMPPSNITGLTDEERARLLCSRLPALSLKSARR